MSQSNHGVLPKLWAASLPAPDQRHKDAGTQNPGIQSAGRVVDQQESAGLRNTDCSLECVLQRELDLTIIGSSVGDAGASRHIHRDC